MKQEIFESSNFTLPTNEFFSRSALLKSLQKQYPRYSSGSFSWVIQNLITTKTIFRAGYNRYSSKPSRCYLGGLDDSLILKIRSLLLQKGNLRNFVVFDSSFLNEWLNELIAHRTTIVEVDRLNMDYAFDMLKGAFSKAAVLLNPTVEERMHYAKSQTIVVLPLASRSPMPLGNGKMSLEKLAVDVLADRGLRQFFSLDEASRMVSLMLSSYSYDERVLLCYAKRRNVEEEINNVIVSLKGNISKI